MSHIGSVTVYICVECEHESEEVNEDKLYECGECSTKFSASNGGGRYGNRCESCNKFAAKVADRCCEDCEAGEVEAEERDACPFCGQGPSDLSEHLADQHAGELAEHYVDCHR